jgi:hypothetical protein
VAGDSREVVEVDEAEMEEAETEGFVSEDQTEEDEDEEWDEDDDLPLSNLLFDDLPERSSIVDCHAWQLLAVGDQRRVQASNVRTCHRQGVLSRIYANLRIS